MPYDFDCDPAHGGFDPPTDLPPLPTIGFIRQPRVLAELGFSASTMWLKIAEHAFPAPVRLGRRISGWRVEDVRAYIADPEGWGTKNRLLAIVATNTSRKEAGDDRK